MLKSVKRFSLQFSKNLGLFNLFRDSRWRNQRLLILCYHATSLEDEHEWRPSFYMQASEIEARFEMLKKGGYTVLPFAEAIERLYKNDLPPRSTTITFDDGDYGFYKLAHPLLKAYNFPATVYLTTYHCDYNKPIFALMCSYMMWKRSGRVLTAPRLIGEDLTLDLRTDAGQEKALSSIVQFTEREKLSASEKNELAARLAGHLEIDYEELLTKRILHLMNPKEVAELARAGIDFQLHTHRHRTPLEQDLYQKEIRDNRKRIVEITGMEPLHFCYPSGVYRLFDLPWLKQERVASATTCEPGIASAKSNPLLLPRLVDHRSLSMVEFEGWLTGVSSFMPRKQSYAGKAD